VDRARDSVVRPAYACPLGGSGLPYSWTIDFNSYGKPLGQICRDAVSAGCRAAARRGRDLALQPEAGPTGDLFSFPRSSVGMPSGRSSGR
jgi:hypothetical protein